MKIGIIDADLMWRPHVNGRRYGNTKADIYPNLCCMKISAYHKAQGDDVDWYNGIDQYDRVYVSRVFSTTPDRINSIYNADTIVYGGTGYCISLLNGKEIYRIPADKTETLHYGLLTQTRVYSHELPYEVEHIMPDYSLYHMVKDTAYGFLTRGCPRGCTFCHVALKEGRCSCKVADLCEWWQGQKNIVLQDPNILACKDASELLQQLADSNARVDINQGIDARLMTPEKAMLLDKIKLSTIHFAWDRYSERDKVLKGLQLFSDHYHRKLDKGHLAQVYVLTNYDTTQEQDLERVYTLRDMGYEPYIMVYDKAHAAPFYKSLQRWVNMRAIFHKIDHFEDYSRRKSKE